MEFEFLLAVLLFQAAFLTRSTADAEPLDHELLSSRFPFHLELEQIASKVSLLEVEIEERTIELRNKDESIRRMENIIQDKSYYITLLKSEIEFLQFQQGEIGGKETGLKELTTDDLESWAAQYKKKINELNLKVLSLQNVNNEQKTRIRKMELALQVMEEELTRTKPETVPISKDTVMVCGDGLPQLASIYFSHYQSLLVNFLNEQGKPAMAATFHMAIKKKSQLKKWCESYIETIDKKWIPNLKDQWLQFTTYLEPHVPNVVFKVVEVYHAAADSIISEVVKEVQKSIQQLFKLVVEITKYHRENAQYFLMQYNGIFFHARQNFIRSVPLYHAQVQEMLKSNHFIKPFATLDLAWFAATVLLALPLILLFRLFSAISGKKVKKFNGSKHGRHGAKRSQPS